MTEAVLSDRHASTGVNYLNENYGVRS